jgi:hypothetical protein
VMHMMQGSRDELLLTPMQDKEKPLAVRSSNIVAARGMEHRRNVVQLAGADQRQLLPTPSGHPWGRGVWTR